ncbi:MAG: chorismate synthase [Planctomycetota bacterium]|jgi:chorismate synthase
MLEGLPAGLPLDLERANQEMTRRQGGYGRGGRMKIERDHVEILSGTKAGLTIGSPIALRVPNKDAVIERLPIPSNPRPGHADLAGCQKFGHRDARAVLERASARETAARVALAGIARQLLEHFQIEVFGHLVELGGVRADRGCFDQHPERGQREELRAASDFQCLDPATEEAMRAAVDEARANGDSLGGRFEVRALGLPPGLGSYASGPERLTARLGGALFSIPAMKAVEFGLGLEAGRRPGSLVHDPILVADEAHPSRWGRFARASNNAGGLEGGMTTGEAIVTTVTMKPIPSLRQGIESVDFNTGEPCRANYERSDVTSVPAASVVGEAEVALVLTDAFLDKFGGDSMAEVEGAFAAYADRLRSI